MEKDGNEERESWRAGGISSNDFKEKEGRRETGRRGKRSEIVRRAVVELVITGDNRLVLWSFPPLFFDPSDTRSRRTVALLNHRCENIRALRIRQSSKRARFLSSFVRPSVPKKSLQVGFFAALHSSTEIVLLNLERPLCISLYIYICTNVWKIWKQLSREGEFVSLDPSVRY